MNVLRVIVDQDGPPTWNMAADEALLLGEHPATLRLYGWAPHAVSLGYFQSLRDFADLPAATPIVRRLTGGGAIHHGDEITFALAVDAALLAGDVGDSYRRLHDEIVVALAAAGVACQRLDAGDPQHARPRQRWCFATPGRDDLVTNRGKLLGSAQRRIHSPRPRVLHHGSLVLQRPALTPFVAAVGDVAAPPTRPQLRSLLAAAVAQALGLVAQPGQWTAAEHERTTSLEPRYRDANFTARR